jgi:hypothetical protein
MTAKPEQYFTFERSMSGWQLLYSLMLRGIEISKDALIEHGFGEPYDSFFLKYVWVRQDVNPTFDLNKTLMGKLTGNCTKLAFLIYMCIDYSKYKKVIKLWQQYLCTDLINAIRIEYGYSKCLGDLRAGVMERPEIETKHREEFSWALRNLSGLNLIYFMLLCGENNLFNPNFDIYDIFEW